MKFRRICVLSLSLAMALSAFAPLALASTSDTDVMNSPIDSVETIFDLPTPTQSSFARNVKSSGLYITSEREIPIAVENAATNFFEAALPSMAALMTDVASSEQIINAELNKGFAPKAVDSGGDESYFFPIVAGERIVIMLFVSWDVNSNQYIVTANNALVNELNYLKAFTSEANPATIYTSDNGYLVKLADGMTAVLDVSPIKSDASVEIKSDLHTIQESANTISAFATPIESDSLVVAVLENEIYSTKPDRNIDNAIPMKTAPAEVKPLPKMEQLSRASYPVAQILDVPTIYQGSWNWCWAASYASVAQYFGTRGTPSMQDVVRTYHGSLLNAGLWDGDEEYLLRRMGRSGYNTTTSFMADVSKGFISYYQPLILTLKPNANWSNEGHIVVLNGYDWRGPCYYVLMDPNFGYTFTTGYSNGIVYYTQGQNYYWVGTTVMSR